MSSTIEGVAVPAQRRVRRAATAATGGVHRRRNSSHSAALVEWAQAFASSFTGVVNTIHPAGIQFTAIARELLFTNVPIRGIVATAWRHPVAACASIPPSTCRDSKGTFDGNNPAPPDTWRNSGSHGAPLPHPFCGACRHRLGLRRRTAGAEPGTDRRAGSAADAPPEQPDCVGDRSWRADHVADRS